MKRRRLRTVAVAAPPPAPVAPPTILCARCGRIMGTWAHSSDAYVPTAEACRCVNPIPSPDGVHPFAGVPSAEQRYRAILRDVLFGGGR